MKRADGNQYALTADANTTNTAGWNSPVRTVVICNHYLVGWAPPIPYWSCSKEWTV